jgi:hypothetical protein
LLSKIYEKYDSYQAVSNQVSSALSRFVWRETVYREARFVGSSENVFSTTLKLREHLRLSWRTAWDIAFRLRKGESVSVTTVLSNVQAVAAFINMPKITFSSED